MKQQKPNAVQRKLAADWEAMQDRWASAPKFARVQVSTGRSRLAAPQLQNFPPTTPEARSVIASFATPGGSTALAPAKVYTGTAIIGIATMHKSNLIPIFNTEAAKDVAAMRR